MPRTADGYNSLRKEPKPLKMADMQNPSGKPSTSSSVLAPSGMFAYARMHSAESTAKSQMFRRRPSTSVR